MVSNLEDEVGVEVVGGGKLDQHHRLDSQVEVALVEPFEQDVAVLRRLLGDADVDGRVARQADQKDEAGLEAGALIAAPSSPDRIPTIRPPGIARHDQQHVQLPVRRLLQDFRENEGSVLVRKNVLGHVPLGVFGPPVEVVDDQELKSQERADQDDGRVLEHQHPLELGLRKPERGVLEHISDRAAETQQSEDFSPNLGGVG